MAQQEMGPRRRIAITIAGAVLAVEGLAGCANITTVTNPATPTSSEAAGTPNPDKLKSFDLNSILESMKGDGYPLDGKNWHLIVDSGTPGAVMTPDSTGMNHVVSTLENTVGQAYWDAKVKGKYQAISLVLAPGISMPVRGITEWPVLPGQTNAAATQLAFEGQANLEHKTQPNVCTLEITQSMQAVTGSEQTVALDQWEAEKLTPEQAAERFGIKGTWSGKIASWSNTPDGYGAILAPNPDGSNSIVKMTNALGQVYWDVKVAGKHQAIAGTLGVGVIAPVRGATVYAGVPHELKQEALDNAFNKAVNLEITTQEGVWVVKVSKSDCPPANKKTAQTTTGATAEPKAIQTAKPEANTTPTNWMQSYENRLGERAHPLDGFSNGLKIEFGKKVKITIAKGERIDTPIGSFNGPWTGFVSVATIWKLN